MPEQWKGKYWWEDRADDEWYDQTKTADPERDLADMIATLRPDTGQAERKHVLSFMHKAFCYLPKIA